jgi:molybdate/tungstate transport system substrate-binding protein
MGNRYRALNLILVLLAISFSACAQPASTGDGGSDSKKIPLVVFAAGSLILPFQDLEASFESQYPGIDIQAKYHGSIQVIRHATELHQQIDVIATADASLIPMLMYAVTDPDTNLPYADWYIRFAGNHLALAYQSDSLYAAEINTDNWYSILSRPEIKVGIPDPRFDAAGYRALMAFALARDYYHKPTIFMDMFGGNFTYPLGIFADANLTTLTVPEIVETIPGSNIVIRGGSIALLALLESGDLDYTFEYESVIRQHNLEMVRLPEAVNLGEAAFADLYNTVEVDLDFQRFVSVKPLFRGEQIGYGITIPDNSPHPQEAALFIAYLLGTEGRAIMQADSQPLFDPALGDNYTNIPAELQSFCVPSETP